MAKQSIVKRKTAHRTRSGRAYPAHTELRAIWDRLDGLTSVDNSRLVITRNGRRTFFDVIAGAGGSGGYIVKVTSGGPGASYVGNVYGDGPTADATETGATIRALQIASTDTIPEDTWFVATRIDRTNVESSSSEESSSTEGDYVYYINVARDYA